MIFKSIITSIILFLAFHSASQRKLVFIDSIANLPLENIQVFSLKGKLLAVSNSHGEVLLNGNFEARARSSFYDETIFSSLVDTVYLFPKTNALDEVIVKPVDLDAFYANLIETSKKAALKDTNSLLNGIYFESVLMIDLELNDSIFQTKECLFSLKKNHTPKDIDYILSVSNEKKSYWLTNHQMDTNVLEKLSNIIPDLNSLLDYDLSTKSKFDISFKNKKIENNPNELTVSKANRNSYQVKYNNDSLTSWSKTDGQICMSSRAVSLCFEKHSRTLEFRRDEQGYYLMNGYQNITIRLSSGGKPFLIKMKKGFIESPASDVTEFTKVKNIEDFFESVPYSKDQNRIGFYLFTD